MSLKELFEYTAFLIQKLPDAADPKISPIVVDLVVKKLDEEVSSADKERIPGKTSITKATRIVNYILLKQKHA